MKHDLDSLKLALASAPANHVAAQLTRLVPFLHLAAAPLPNWLYASAGPNRYNPAGIHCVYFGETTEVAQTEYLAAWRRVAGRDQPVATYYAEAFLHRVLDVTSAGTLRALNLSSPQLFKAWRKARYPTVTQLLGQAVNETRLFSAIRFPSNAARTAGLAGVNIVIFRDCVRAPDYVKILGPTKKPLDQWP